MAALLATKKSQEKLFVSLAGTVELLLAHLTPQYTGAVYRFGCWPHHPAAQARHQAAQAVPARPRHHQAPALVRPLQAAPAAHREYAYIYVYIHIYIE